MCSACCRPFTRITWSGATASPREVDSQSGDGVAQHRAAGRMFRRQPAPKRSSAPRSNARQRAIGNSDGSGRPTRCSGGAPWAPAQSPAAARWPGPCEVGFVLVPPDPLVRRPVHGEPDAAGGPIAALRCPAAVWTARHEGSLGRQGVQIALGDQPFIGQQHGDARDGELLGQHAGGWHARARLQPRRGNQCLQLLIELLLQRLVAHQLEWNQQCLGPCRIAQDAGSPVGRSAIDTFASSASGARGHFCPARSPAKMRPMKMNEL